MATPDSIKRAVARFKAKDISADQIQAMLDSLEIELVLTAHPTQAKRRSLMSKLVRISSLLKQLTENEHQHSTENDLIDELYAEISTYWLTERARTAKPEVTDEVRTGLYFIDEVLGLCYFRVPTWSPFGIQFYCNGHHHLYRALDKKSLICHHHRSPLLPFSQQV